MAVYYSGPNYFLNQHEQPNVCPFKVGDKVVCVKYDGIIQSGQIATVVSVPGMPLYELKRYMSPESGMEVICYIDMRPTWTQWANWKLLTDEQEIIPTFDVEFDDSDGVEFDDDCTIDCKPGEHVCGKQ